MVTLTEKAAQKVLEFQAAEEVKHSALRLGLKGGGCSGFTYDLFFDEPKAGDHQLELRGVKIVIDPMSAMYLAGTEIDFVDGLNGTGFSFSNANVKSKCGCGSSIGF